MHSLLELLAGLGHDVLDLRVLLGYGLSNDLIGDLLSLFLNIDATCQGLRRLERCHHTIVHLLLLLLSVLRLLKLQLQKLVLLLQDGDLFAGLGLL